MDRRHTPPVSAGGTGRAKPAGTVHDVGWAGEAWSAAGCAVLLLGLLLVVDAASGELTPVLAAVWAALAALLFAVLLPARVSAGEGWLSSRGLLQERVVRTDRLVSVRWSDGVARRLILTDTDGERVELEPRALLGTPQLWHRLDADARTSLRNGTLRTGPDALRRLGRHLDGETALLVFRRSGLE